MFSWEVDRQEQHILAIQNLLFQMLITATEVLIINRPI